MLSQKNILIFTSKTGGGHLSLAEALRDLIEADIQAELGQTTPESAARSNVSITLADPQPDIFETHYRLVSRHALRLWAFEFQFLNTPSARWGRTSSSPASCAIGCTPFWIKCIPTSS